ncbi:MAG TPA: FkbM family methyltransferase [Sulfuricaulis sp.]|nr:FkbM family methyltransferase [Sulfuricaulis sp.]
MTKHTRLRRGIRALRLYYRSHALFRAALTDTTRTWFFPFFGRGEFRTRLNGRILIIPRRHWTMLPTACRLLLFGAWPEWRNGFLRVTLGRFHLVAAPREKSVHILKEIFVDDVYRLGNTDLRGQTVLDVGANIGGVSIAFAARGAQVYAFEPLPILQPYLQENIALNDFRDRIVVHPVGLSSRDAIVRTLVNASGTAGATTSETVARGDAIEQELRLVEAVPYLQAHDIKHANILKLDCEGCEYELLADTTLLDYLKPDRIVLEYHRGGNELHRFLEGLGYQVERSERENHVGYLYAVRRELNNAAPGTGRVDRGE